MFNTEKTIEGYTSTPLFLGEEPGLFDTVNKQYPKIWGLYKEMKSLAWDENEFDYSQCLQDFNNCPTDTAEMMIRTLAFQWEADSVASRSIIACFAPFITSSELSAAWTEVSTNEVLHSATYSEIVRMSFDDPKKVLQDILQVKESVTRLDPVAKAFSDLRLAGAMHTLGFVENNQELYNKIYAGVATLLMLERIQFMSSFAITFTICSTGMFQAIGKAVQKICQDELEVHVQLDKEILKIENKTQRGIVAKEQTKVQVQAIFDSIVQAELDWVDYLFADNKQLVGANKEMIKDWVLFIAKDACKFLELESKWHFPRSNPMPGLESWININKQQAAPQEQDVVAYKVNNLAYDCTDEVFDIDF